MLVNSRYPTRGSLAQGRKTFQFCVSGFAITWKTKYGLPGSAVGIHCICGWALDQSIFPPFSCGTCEQSLCCLVKIVVLFWEPDIKLQHNSLQKEWQCPSRATYLQLCRARTFISQQIWSFLRNLHSKLKKWKGRMPLHCLFSLRSPPCVLILMYT